MTADRRWMGLALLMISPAAALLTARVAPQSGPTVGSTFKNIQVFPDLKDAPPGKLFETMQFMSGSLGVSCNYCHVSQQGPFDSDANQRKVKAREMIKMVRALNANTFDGHLAVTCYTCHQGRPRPGATPEPWYKTDAQVLEYKTAVAGGNAPSVPPASPVPTVDQIFDRYRRAVGAEKVTSLRLIGVNSVAMSGSSTPFEADAAFPDKFAIQTKTPGGEVQTILNGALGWRRSAGSASPLPPAQLVAARVNADIILRPVKFETSTAPRKAGGIEQIGNRRYDVVETALAEGSQRLYFDAESGLLYKVRTETTTALGSKVEERTFEDYRVIDGVRLPFLIRNHYMEDQSEFRISSAALNVTFDAGRFQGVVGR